MGVAFNNIRQGPGIAYFPAASLAYGENIVVNFGATPFQYLVEGYSPLQLQSSLDNTKTDALLRWTKNVLSLYPGGKFFPEYGRIPNQDYQTLLVITNRLLEFLGPYLHSGFVVEQSFFPFFASCLGLPEKITHNHVISTKDVSYNKTDLLLDIMWTFLEVNLTNRKKRHKYIHKWCKKINLSFISAGIGDENVLGEIMHNFNEPVSFQFAQFGLPIPAL